MSSLADLPQLVGFFSYARDDDEGSSGHLSKLRERIQEELRAQLGRTRRDFRLWQDKAAIAHGKLWEDEIETAIAEATFFIPIVTPTAIRSQHCKFEFESFLAREQALGRNDLVFPIHYVLVSALQDEARWRQDRVLSIIGSRQYIDWLSLRHLDVGSTELRVAVERFCANIVRALQQSWLSPEEAAHQQAEAEARRRADEERRRRAEAERQAEDVRRHKQVEAEALARAAEAARRRQIEATPIRPTEPSPLLSDTPPAGTTNRPTLSESIPKLVGLALGIQGVVRLILIVPFIPSLPRFDTLAFLLVALLISPGMASVGIAVGVLRRQLWTRTLLGPLLCFLCTAHDLVWLILWAVLFSGAKAEAVFFVLAPMLGYLIVDVISLYYLVRAWRRTDQA